MDTAKCSWSSVHFPEICRVSQILQKVQYAVEVSLFLARKRPLHLGKNCRLYRFFARYLYLATWHSKNYHITLCFHLGSLPGIHVWLSCVKLFLCLKQINVKTAQQVHLTMQVPRFYVTWLRQIRSQGSSSDK